MHFYYNHGIVFFGVAGNDWNRFAGVTLCQKQSSRCFGPFARDVSGESSKRAGNVSSAIPNDIPALSTNDM